MLNELQLQEIEIDLDQGQNFEAEQDQEYTRLELIEQANNRLNNPDYQEYLKNTDFYKELVKCLGGLNNGSK